MSDIYIGKSSYTYNEGRHDVFIIPCKLYKANNSVYINVPDNHYIAHNGDYVAMLVSGNDIISNFEKFGFVPRGTDLYHTSNGSGTKITFGGDFAYVFEDYVLSFGKHQINGKLVWTIYLYGVDGILLDTAICEGGYELNSYLTGYDRLYFENKGTNSVIEIGVNMDDMTIHLC